MNGGHGESAGGGKIALGLVVRAATSALVHSSLKAGLVLSAAGAVIAISVVVFSTKPVIAVPLFGAALLAAALVLAGNPRLFCLWGLLLTVPLDISKAFMVVPHIGGSPAFRLELCDPFILTMLAFQIRDRFRGTRGRLRLPGVAYWWIGLMLMGVGAIIVGPFRLPAAHETFRMFKAFLLLLILVNELVRVRHFQHFSMALMIGVLAQAVIGIVQYALKIQFGLPQLGEPPSQTIRDLAKGTIEEGIFRVGALQVHPNLLAAYLGMLLPIALAVLLTRLRLGHKAFYTLVLMLGGVVLVFTFSRAGWITNSLAFIGVFALITAHPRLRTRYLLARLFIIVGVVFLVTIFSGRIMQRITRSDPGAWNFRVEWMNVAMRSIEEKPLLGTGLNSFVFATPQFSKYGDATEMWRRLGTWPVVHNIYMLVCAEQGIIGLALFLAMHIHLIVIGLRNLRVRDELLFAVNAGCLCGLLSVMVDGLASFTIRMDAQGRIYWTIIAGILAVDYWYRANRRPRYSNAIEEISGRTPFVLGGVIHP